MFFNKRYKMVSGNSFFRTFFNKGNYGEFRIFNKLDKLDGENFILCNVYLPTKKGKTTEVDLVMINETGIYVFESKNYGGWIFGNDKDRNWTVTTGKNKYRFYNPIKQNEGHIKALKLNLNLDDDSLYKSYIVFGERCTLKKVKVNAEGIKVIKRDRLKRAISKDIKSSKKVFSVKQVNDIYIELNKCVRVDDETKKKHIENIKKTK